MTLNPYCVNAAATSVASLVEFRRAGACAYAALPITSATRRAAGLLAEGPPSTVSVR